MIDTSPEELAQLREWLQKHAVPRETSLALLDALEEAQAEIERLTAERDMDVMMAENAALNEIPAAAPPGDAP